MPITYRIDKGSALTYQELDDNFREVAGNPNVRWLKLKNTTLKNLTSSGNDLAAIVSWKNLDHTDSTHYNFNSDDTITILKNGVYRTSVDVVIEYHADSSLSNNVRLDIEVNGSVVSNTFKVPHSEHEVSFDSLKIYTLLNLTTNDQIKIKVVADNQSGNASYNIADNKGEITLEWAGYNP